ncbi:gamma carbonic anhydrase family protein [Methanobrevibacter sp. TMH8]|uniref:gamma carbonic anhydrase family protein n=1 Tax=Methanobrevibacter sp. TMH8 TaxID=2848611 RepID=UPI001CCA1E2C|nr:gamma carbonic anhydrase family protein [Methanobrevibacter sp. TMH8]MBZ9570090.1 gamma carbonic anhydrase family protein [Methanobrevibacter sp. TMH8]
MTNNNSKGIKPNIDDSVKLFKGSHIIGDVTIGEESSVWYNAVIRGDRGPIVIGKNSNVQDNCIIHCSDTLTTTLGDYVSIGHGAIVHGCQIGENVIIGMNSTILNDAKIGNDSLVGAGSVVTQGKEFPDKSLILGTPAKLIRELTDEEVEKLKVNALIYVELAKEHQFSISL